MLTLVPFAEANNDIYDIGVSGDVVIADNVLSVIFYWQDPRARILFADRHNNERRYELWKTTCFEVFLQPAGQEEYIEINIAPTGEWDAYTFTRYRQPQPPQRSECITLLHFDWRSNGLEAQFAFAGKHMEWRCSLTAVIELQDHSKHYLALKHATDKPDFHHHESFILGRKPI